jgi:riboflavin kinase / FMN adenylyltransferase
MKVVQGIDALEPALGRAFVVVGVFDGLHRGHHYLLEHLVEGAAARSAKPTVITFDHHPDEVITGTAPPLLCDPEERIERLAEAGVAVTVVQTFDVALRMTPFEAFIRRIADRVELAGFLMTPESAFGHDRGGTPATVAALGRELGYETVVVPQFELDGRPVRSSDVRAAIAAGDLVEAERLLGRPVSLVGRVDATTGDATTLRFPLPVAVPPAGRYEAIVESAAGPMRDRTVEIAAAAVRIEPAVPFAPGARLGVLPTRRIR